MRRHVLSIRCGMTLVEMLVAMAASLLLMAAIARAFAAFSGAMSNSRAILETDARLRSAAHRLRTDLQGATTQMLPPRNPAQGEGYFEVIEGPLGDYSGAVGEDLNGNNAIDSGEDVNDNGILDLPEVAATDIDDVVLFTTRNTDTPFIGRVGSGTMESTTAEVAWFARATPGTTGPVTYTLYRRQLLVMGYVGVSPFGNNNQILFSPPPSVAPARWTNYFLQPCDISARREFAPSSFDRIVPNNLSDLTRRENRFLHNSLGDTTGSNFPYPFVSHQTGTPDGLTFDGTIREGEDIVLTNVLAFDVRVFDPAAAVGASGTTANVPGDPGFNSGGAGSGAYVDLGHGFASNPLLASPTIPAYFANVTTQVGGASDLLTRTYCTWSTHYEANGLDEDGDFLTDEGTDGLDNLPVNSLVDDPGEQETSPPYPYPLRGIEVRIRVYEPSSRQVRQVTVRQTFVPH